MYEWTAGVPKKLPNSVGPAGNRASQRPHLSHFVYFFLITALFWVCISTFINQVGAMMVKSTRPVYWGRTVITGRTVVGDMIEWTPSMCSVTSS